VTCQILALDLALKTGWALGTVNDTAPQSGSIQIVREDASMAKLFACWREQLRDFLAMHPDIKLVVFEAPLPPFMKAGNTNIQTIRRLIGLAAVTEELLYSLGKYDIREARVGDVRVHFLGSNRFKRAEPKARTIAKCKLLGWAPVDDNAADALALWDYQVACLRRDNLFNRSR
jgi:hypothetical protein